MALVVISEVARFAHLAGVRFPKPAAAGTVAIRFHLPLNSRLVVTFRPMGLDVLSAVNHLQVLRTIVGFIPVQMMDLFVATERPTQKALRNDLMLVPFPAVVMNADISAALNPCHPPMIRHGMLRGKGDGPPTSPTTAATR
jgi:hypothetical protein